MQLILGQFNIVKRYIFETVQGALLFASLLFCFFLRFQVFLIIHFDITVHVFFFFNNCRFYNAFNDCRCFVG